MSTYDSPWKEAFDLLLRPLLQLLFPDVEAEIDWTLDYESLEQELRQIVVDGEEGLRLADKLIKVRTLSGDERILHVEVQAQPRQGFERRVYICNYRCDDRFGIPPEALVILADEDPRWKPPMYEVRLKRTRLTFEFEAVKLLDWADRKDELRIHPNPMGLFVLAHLEAQRTHKDDEVRAQAKLDLLLHLVARKVDETEMRQWYRYLDWFLNLPDEIDARVYQQVQTQIKEKAMPFVTFADRQARKEGQIEGRLEGIEVLLRVRFGDDGKNLIPQARQIADPERLADLLQALETTDSLETIRGMLPPLAANGNTTASPSP